jgi:hypothetical protein
MKTLASQIARDPTVEDNEDDDEYPEMSGVAHESTPSLRDEGDYSGMGGVEHEAPPALLDNGQPSGGLKKDRGETS